MKKMLALLVALCMVLSLCPALAEETQELKDARSYINLMYKNKPASTPKDYELVGSVPGDDAPYTVEWTTDSDTITVTRQEDGKTAVYMRGAPSMASEIPESGKVDDELTGTWGSAAPDFSGEIAAAGFRQSEGAYMFGALYEYGKKYVGAIIYVNGTTAMVKYRAGFNGQFAEYKYDPSKQLS